MEAKTMSSIISIITYSLRKVENCQGQCREKKTGKEIKWSITIEEPESFIDEKGIKWVRA